MSADGIDSLHPRGPAIGSFKGESIFEFLTESGSRFVYDRIATTSADGTIDPEQMNDGEMMVKPGLIYRS